jgi:hypothetical protein
METGWVRHTCFCSFEQTVTEIARKPLDSPVSWTQAVEKLLVPQCQRRLNIHRLACGEVARQQSHDDQEKRD